MLTDDDIFVCENGSPEDLMVHISALRERITEAIANEKRDAETIEKLREDLDRLTRGGWSKELARITAANMALRAKIEMFQAWREKAINLYPDLERLE